MSKTHNAQEEGLAHPHRHRLTGFPMKCVSCANTHSGLEHESQTRARLHGQRPFPRARTGLYSDASGVAGKISSGPAGRVRDRRYEADYYQTLALRSVDPKGQAAGASRVLRGGCWVSLCEVRPHVRPEQEDAGARGVLFWVPVRPGRDSLARHTSAK
jgi:hypothetical protein